MGQKTHPTAFRLGITEDWSSKWFTKNEVAKFIQEDYMIRRYITKRIKGGAISKIQIQRTPKRVIITIHTARPGIVIGRKGALIDRLRDELKLAVSRDVAIEVQEIRDPELDATLVAESVARRIEQRVSYRRAMKRAVAEAMKLGAKGIRVATKGRLMGAEIARCEWYREGKIPLHTIRAKIDYACTTARVVYGMIGIKVWIYKGETT
ncbi:MAG: 30S ribosomal protein S3 [bacterium]|nr:30S ribosomal protein S3 [bacterium]